MGEKYEFDGVAINDLEVELTGGGTHDTELMIHGGDLGVATVSWKCVNVKHPFKAGVRLMTLNITSLDDVQVTEKYVAPAPDPTLDGVGGDVTISDSDEGSGDETQIAPVPEDDPTGAEEA